MLSLSFLLLSATAVESLKSCPAKMDKTTAGRLWLENCISEPTGGADVVIFCEAHRGPRPWTCKGKGKDNHGVKWYDWSYPTMHVECTTNGACPPYKTGIGSSNRATVTKSGNECKYEKKCPQEPEARSEYEGIVSIRWSVHTAW